MVNLRAAMKLADPHFYRKEPWMYEYAICVFIDMFYVGFLSGSRRSQWIVKDPCTRKNMAARYAPHTDLRASVIAVSCVCGVQAAVPAALGVAAALRVHGGLGAATAASTSTPTAAA